MFLMPSLYERATEPDVQPPATEVPLSAKPAASQIQWRTTNAARGKAPESSSTTKCGGTEWGLNTALELYASEHWADGPQRMQRDFLAAPGGLYVDSTNA